MHVLSSAFFYLKDCILSVWSEYNSGVVSQLSKTLNAMVQTLSGQNRLPLFRFAVDGYLMPFYFTFMPLPGAKKQLTEKDFPMRNLKYKSLVKVVFFNWWFSDFFMFFRRVKCLFQVTFSLQPNLSFITLLGQTHITKVAWTTKPLVQGG